MNLTTHCVSPEEIMAYLDGDFSASDAEALSSHIDQCEECSELAKQFRAVSQLLSHWEVPFAPAKLEEAVLDAATQSNAGQKLRRPGFFLRASLWTPKQWAFRSIGAFAATLLIVAIFLPFSRHEDITTMEKIEPYSGQSAARVRSDVNSEFSNSIVAGVASAGAQRDALAVRQMQPQEMVAAPTPAPPPEPKRVISGTADHAPNAPVPMIARTVSLTIVVKDFSAARFKLDAILAHYQGYAAQLTVNTPENAPRNFQASIRIPAPFLSAATNDLRALGRVENESQSGEEVTQQHADLVARLKTARDTEDRLRAILQQRTGKIEDVLQVEEEIARVRGEIESMEAEQKGLEHRVDFASIDLQLTEEYKAQLNPPSNSASTRMHNAFVAGYRNAANLLFGIVLFFTEYGPTLLIVAAILGVPVFFLWRRYRRMLAKA